MRTCPPNWRNQIRLIEFALSAIWCGLAVCNVGFSQSESGGGVNPSSLPDKMVRIDQKPVTLDGLIKLAGSQLREQGYRINYEYSPEVGAKPINIQTPVELPLRALPLLISSAIQAANLAIVDSDVPGFKKIVASSEMIRFAPFSTDDPKNILQREGPGAPVIQLFLLKRYSPETIGKLLSAFQSDAGKQIGTLTLPESNILIVTDYASNVKRMAEFIELIDRIGETVFEFYQVKNQRSKELADRVQLILGGRVIESAAGIPSDTDRSANPAMDSTTEPLAPPSASVSPTSASGNGANVRLFDDVNANRVIVVGRRDLVAEALQLLERLDFSIEMKTIYYAPKNMSAERLQRIIEGSLQPQDRSRAYSGTIDEAGNLLIVRATPEIHQKIELILKELDQTPSATEMPIRIKKLRNAKAEDVLLSLLALQDAYGTGFGGLGGAGGQFFGGAFGFQIPGFGQGLNPLGMGLPGQLGVNPSQFGNGVATLPLPLTPGQPTTTGFGTTGAGAGFGTGAGSGTGILGRGGRQSRSDQQQARANGLGGMGSGLSGGLGGGFGGSALLPGGARVSADLSTNSLIIAAPANVQPMYERLIDTLDQRRPQVSIRATFVSMNANDTFSFGFEASGGDRNGPKRKFLFTSFGLSEVDPISGAMKIIPGRGINGTVVNPDAADAVLRALVTHRRARILSSPSILVNDNQTGELSSKESIPFQSVNASNTVSTTSLGGSQEAGTEILVTPRINEDDNLLLEYEIEFSSFVGTGTATLPPARRIERASSEITVPDGQTVIIGGLRRNSDSRDYVGVPWLEKIPVVRDFLGKTDENQDNTSFFVFLHPRIYRDSRFRDLQFVSDKEAGLAGVPSEYPTSEPILMPSRYPSTEPSFITP